MKRDFDLIREILLVVESKQSSAPLRNIPIEGYERKDIDYNTVLLIENGFLKGVVKHTTSGTLIVISDMTYQGHDLLDNIRDQRFFDKIKSYTKEKGMPLTFESIKTIVPVLIQSFLP